MFKRSLNLVVIFWSIYFFIPFVTNAQCPEVGFTIPASTCINQNVAINNSSTNSLQYEWDLCSGDLETSPTIASLLTISATSTPTGYRTVKDGVNFYGFITSRGNNSLFRINFGTNPRRSLTAANVVSLTTINNYLKQPEDIVFYKEGSDWYAFVLNMDPLASGIVLIKFGSSLSNAPAYVKNITDHSSLNSPRRIQLLEEGGQKILAISNFNSSTITFINLKGSVLNNPVTGDVFITDTLSGVTNLGGMVFVKNCNKWYGFTSGNGSGNTTRLNFDSGLMKDPSSIAELYSDPADKPYGLTYIEEGGERYLISSTAGGKILKLKFASQIDGVIGSTININNVSGLSSIFGIDFIKDGSAYTGYALNYLSKTFYRLAFSETCNTLSSTTTASSPLVSYTAPGIYKISLTGADNNGNKSTIGKTIKIVETTTPDFTISSGLLCSNKEIVFTNTSTGNVASDVPWKWEYFSDDTGLKIGETSDKDGKWIFSSLGSYSIKLTSGSTGCQFTTIKQIVVSGEGAKVDFIYSENCFGKNTTFTNQTSGTNITSFTWDFGDPASGVNNSSSQLNPTHSFTAAGDYWVKLTAINQMGCSVEKAIKVTVYSSPSIDFNNSAGLSGESINFTVGSLSNGDVIDQLTWNFGDPASGTENTSNAFTASHTFNIAGIYNVLLSIKTKAGCELSATKKVYVFENSSADCPTANFDIPSYLCINEPLSLQNNSKDGYTFNWDFCSGDIDNQPTFTSLLNINALNTPTGYRMVFDGTNWFGFITSRSSNSLFKVNFGNSPRNSITASSIVNLGTIGGNLKQPEDIIFYKEGSDWYGIVANMDAASSGIALFKFGNVLSNLPTFVKNINHFGSLNSPRRVQLIEEGEQKILVATNFNSNNLTFINLKESILNNPSPSDVFTSKTIPEIINPAGIAFVKNCNQWYGFVNGNGSFNLIRLDFGNGLMDNPTSVKEIYKDVSEKPYGLVFIEDGGEYYLISSGALGKIIRYKFVGGLEGFITATNLNNVASGLSSTFGIDFVKDGTTYTGHVLNYLSKDFFQVIFNQSCGTNTATSISPLPAITYSQTGNYKIGLKVNDRNGNSSITYKKINIVEATIPDFIVPSGVLCTNQQFNFSNVSTGNTDVPWLWEYFDEQQNKLGESNLKDGEFTFMSLGTYTIKLTGGFSGCQHFSSKNIILTKEGSIVNFKLENVCLGETTKFTDQTTGGSPKTRIWDFGDGNTSTNQLASNTYTAKGIYNVSLKVTNANGCEVTKTKQVQIHDLPAVDFILPGFLCNADSLQFADASTLSDGNITGWKWEVADDKGAVINEQFRKDPKIMFTETGNYKVTLTATSEAGCSSSSSKSFAIIKSPEIDMSVTNLCAGESANLEGISKLAGQNIVGWTWETSDGGIYDSQIAKHKFVNPGKYTIYLTAIADNSCPKVIIKEVTVNPTPVSNFSSSNNCTNAPVQFTDLSTVNNDVINTWNWKIFNEQQTLINEQSVKDPQYVFTIPGNYQIELTTTSSQGCSSTLKKVVVINPLPMADFVFTPEVGPPPFEVQFENRSKDANTYLWDFGNGETSTETTPRYTYNELGTYDVKLIAYNSFGCTDTLIRRLLVAPPVTSVSMERILVSALTDELAFAIEIKNNGTKIIRSIELIIDFGGNLSFKEIWTGTLYPEAIVTHSLKTQLLKDQLSKVKYMCITADELNDEAFEFKTNKVCVNLAEQFLVFNAMPNPAAEQVSFFYILPEQKDIVINFYTPGGQKLAFNNAQYTQGFNKCVYDVSRLTKGMYFVEFIYDGQRVKKKLVVN